MKRNIKCISFFAAIFLVALATNIQAAETPTPTQTPAPYVAPNPPAKSTPIGGLAPDVEGDAQKYREFKNATPVNDKLLHKDLWEKIFAAQRERDAAEEARKTEKKRADDWMAMSKKWMDQANEERKQANLRVERLKNPPASPTPAPPK